MAHFAVKNFAKFQHYKDRTPPWIKLYNELLDDYAFAALPDASKAHLLAIWLLASRYENQIPFDAKWVARRINATEEVDLVLLVTSGFIVTDQDCSNLLAERKQTAIPERETERETEERKRQNSKTAAVAAPKRSRKSLPSDFPNPEAKQESINYWTKIGRADLCDKADDEFQAFRDHHIAKATSSADWRVSLRTWSRNAAKWSKQHMNGHGAPEKPTVFNMPIIDLTKLPAEEKH